MIISWINFILKNWYWAIYRHRWHLCPWGLVLIKFYIWSPPNINLKFPKPPGIRAGFIVKVSGQHLSQTAYKWSIDPFLKTFSPFFLPSTLKERLAYYCRVPPIVWVSTHAPSARYCHAWSIFLAFFFLPRTCKDLGDGQAVDWTDKCSE